VDYKKAKEVNRTMAQRLKGKSAAVTGGGDGIGRGVALALAAEGAKVVVNDIARESDGTSKADNVVAEIVKAGGSAVVNYDSVATMSGGDNIVKAATDNFGRIDILVCCAGNHNRMHMVDMTEKDWDSIIEVHLKGHFTCCRAAAVEMVKQKSGRIINFSSRAAFSYFVGPPNSVAYAAAKAGILGLTAQLSGELKEYGITVNAILPSAVTKLFPEERPKVGGGDTGAPDTVAPIVAYLATDEAKDITGQFFYATGGDICIYSRPIQIPGPHMFIRKADKWTVDELVEVIPPLVKLG
jgi:NAD(P)-dependent dehydrogenase (short-subunit alcohol dehydrogenase family)